MKKIKLVLKVLVLNLFAFIISFSLNIGQAARNNEKIFIETPEYVTYLDYKLKKEIEAYIKDTAPNSKLSSDSILSACRQYDLKISFVLAQAHIESHFGTIGIASRTNSVFNVGTFDNGVILYRYQDPNLSIKPYASLLTRRYLVNGKTEDDLLKIRKFVNDQGKRYASLKVYEYRVKKVYDNINSDTDITKLQQKIDRINNEPQLYVQSVTKLFELISIKNKNYEFN